jgi:hypothetical protein
VIEQKQSGFKLLEIDLIPDDLEGGVCKKTLSIIPLEAATRALFENGIRWHPLPFTGWLSPEVAKIVEPV